MGSTVGKIGKTIFDPFNVTTIGREGIPVDNMGRPAAPDYFDANGMMKDQYKLSNGDQWSGLAKDKLAQATSEGRDFAAREGAGANIQARDQLASRGGLSGGAAALLARQGQTDQMNNQQAVTQGNIKGLNDIGLKQFDIGREAEKTNLANTLGLKQSIYDAQMGEYGASKTADSAAQIQNQKGILGK